MIQEIELTQEDKASLKVNIRISLIIGLLFSIALVFLIAIGTGIAFLFVKKPSNGFVTRCLIGLGILFIPFLAISWKNILKYLDIIKGRKLEIITNDYEIKKKKSSVLIHLNDNDGRDIEIWDDLVPLIDSSRPLKINVGILSKELIFISHDNINLLNS